MGITASVTYGENMTNLLSLTPLSMFLKCVFLNFSMKTTADQFAFIGTKKYVLKCLFFQFLDENNRCGALWKLLSNAHKQ